MLIDFWTYTCINCIRTLPHADGLGRALPRQGLIVVGVHSPEFVFERSVQRRSGISQNGMRTRSRRTTTTATWNAWGNQYWPAEYLIDAKGSALRALRRGRRHGDRGRDPRPARRGAAPSDLGARRQMRATGPARGESTPETYLGRERAPELVPSHPSGRGALAPATPAPTAR